MLNNIEKVHNSLFFTLPGKGGKRIRLLETRTLDNGRNDGEFGCPLTAGHREGGIVLYVNCSLPRLITFKIEQRCKMI